MSRSIRQRGQWQCMDNHCQTKNTRYSVQTFARKLLIFVSMASILQSAACDRFITSSNMIKNAVEERTCFQAGGKPASAVNIFNSQSDHPKSRKRRSLPTAEESKSAVDAHNYYRSTIGDEGEEPIPSNMMFMTWDPSLSITSLVYAKKCVFEHSVPEERATEHFPGWNGENLWAGFGKFAGTGFDPRIGIEAWFMEYLDYTFDTHYCVPGKKCGHYTQIVWADSYKLGCAWVNCSTFDTTEGEIWNDAAYMVCHYAPGGNEDGTKLYKVGARCSDCHPNDTCPDGRLCRNPQRDVILPGPSDTGHLLGILLSVVAILALVAACAYFAYSQKEVFVGAWRKRRKIGHKSDQKSRPREQNNNNGNDVALPGMTQ